MRSASFGAENKLRAFVRPNGLRIEIGRKRAKANLAKANQHFLVQTVYIKGEA